MAAHMLAGGHAAGATTRAWYVRTMAGTTAAERRVARFAS